MSHYIDCDIHIEPQSLDELIPYLDDFWADYCNESAFVGPDANDYPAKAPLTTRPESLGPDAASPDAIMAEIQRHVFDRFDAAMAILNCCYWVQSVHHPDLAAALATAINQWQIEHWLEADDRLRAGLVVPSQLPEMAAAEIERFGHHPGFVQIILPVRSDAPYGNRRYRPLYEAAVRHDLAIGIHYGGAAGHPPTPSGWPSTFTEEYVDMAQLFQSQVMSLIIEGTFDQHPELRVALIESGVSWLPSLMWRMDKEWKGLRHNIPWVKQPPSDYMRQHFRLTTAPFDAPPDGIHLVQIIEQIESEEMLMFASDYPHWHTEEPFDLFVDTMAEALAEKIGSGNACEFYRL